MTDVEYDSGYDAALKDLYDEFNSYGMESAMKMVSFRLHGQGGETVNRVSTEVRELLDKLHHTIMSDGQIAIDLVEAGKLIQSFADAVRDRALEDAAQRCTIGRYFKATNIAKNLLDAIAREIRAMKKGGA